MDKSKINMSVKEAAELMGKSQQYVRKGLEEGRLTFGSAVKLSTKWTYHIPRNRLYEYLRINESNESSI